jgi:uncharacterized membrane protein YfcA
MDILLLFAAAFLGGALNSVAGGGSFISFPALVSVGVPSINANATNTMALWPGSLASVGAYRAELARQDRRLVIFLSLTSLLGGLSGAEILLRTPQATFDRLLPWLMLFAVAIFAIGGNLTQALRLRFGKQLAVGGVAVAALVAVLQFLIAVYGGFFGGGIGILMLAALALAGMTNIHTMNGLKVLLATLINGVAVLRFVIAGTIFWQYALIMIVGAILGGYGGAAYAQRLDPKIVRRFVIAVGVAMTVYFFIREYAR